MLVKLSYFKPTGKWYSDGEMTVDPMPLYEIWGRVASLAQGRLLPGLQEGHSEFIVLVDVPDHPHAHPHLIIPGEAQPVPTMEQAPLPELPKVKQNVNGAKAVLRAIGLNPKTEKNTKDWYYVFRDDYYGIVVQVPNDKMLMALEALKAAGFWSARFGSGLMAGNIYC